MVLETLGVPVLPHNLLAQIKLNAFYAQSLREAWPTKSPTLALS